MSKVICDICGTSYPETGTSCPICGYTNDAAAQLSPEEYETEYTEPAPQSSGVKGGRFSATNVRKRNKEAKSYQTEIAEEYEESEFDNEPRQENNVFLIVVLILLILALVAATGYIYVRYYLPNRDGAEPTGESYQEQINSSETDATTLDPRIPCESIMLLSSDVVELTRLGQYYLLNTQVQPVNTTDAIDYVSDNEAVATVDGEGCVTVVGAGRAVITITCGDQQTTCTILVNPEEPTEESTEESTEEATEEPTEDPAEDTTEPTTSVEVVKLVLSKTDVKFNSIGVTFTLTYTPADINPEDIIWGTENSEVATIENGVITTRGYGITTVYAEYQGVRVECVVRVVRY